VRVWSSTNLSKLGLAGWEQLPDRTAADKTRYCLRQPICTRYSLTTQLLDMVAACDARLGGCRVARRKRLKFF